MSSDWRRTRSKLEEGRRTKGKNKGATEMARTEPGPLHPTWGSGLQKAPPAKQFFGRWGGRESEFFRITLGVRANLARMDDRYTQMLFVTDLLCKDNGMGSTVFVFVFLNGKGSTNIRKRELKLGRGDICKGMRSLSQEAFKQRVEERLFRAVVEMISLRLYSGHNPRLVARLPDPWISSTTVAFLLCLTLLW